MISLKHRVSLPAFIFCALPALAHNASLTVVRDAGGVSALPYYQALHLKLKTSQSNTTHATVAAPARRTSRYSEADLMPVRSRHLSPGEVTARALRLPGLTPLFLIGNDPQSQAWLQQRAPRLRALHALGLVVNVESLPTLQSLRRQAPGLTLAPASGDDLSGRLQLRHYPVLITATGIEQ